MPKPGPHRAPLGVCAHALRGFLGFFGELKARFTIKRFKLYNLEVKPKNPLSDAPKVMSLINVPR